MTCIVGIIDKGKVYIGADIAGVAGYDISIRKDTKVFINGEFIIGCTSSFRMIQLLRFSFNPPKLKENQDTYSYMCTDFINSLRTCFRDGGFIEVDKSVESGGTFLVGYRGRLFDIENDFQVGENTVPYDSCGCGKYYALGALKNIDETIDPEERIKKALETAVFFNGGVRPPFNILSI